MTKEKMGNPKIKDLGIATRFQPGQSGNPFGRPKTRVLAEMLAAVGNQVEPKSGKTYFQLAAESLVNKAFKGDVQAFKEFADRIDGRATQPVELSGANGQPIAIHSTDAWVETWNAASSEQRQKMQAELEEKILASAAEILARRTKPMTEQERYDAWMREYNRRCSTGEDPKSVRATCRRSCGNRDLAIVTQR